MSLATFPQGIGPNLTIYSQGTNLTFEQVLPSLTPIGFNIWPSGLTLNAGASVNILSCTGTWTLFGNSSVFGLGTLFNFASTIINAGGVASASAETVIYANRATFTADGASGGSLALADLGSGFNYPAVTTVLHDPTLNSVRSGVGTAATVAAVASRGTVATGFTVTDFPHIKLFAPLGSGTITNLIGVDIADWAGRGTSLNVSLRSLGAAVSMQHAGPILVGTTGAPNANVDLDVAGPVAVRRGDLALSNGANADIGSTFSFQRVTGPTGAFSIDGFTNGVDGKVIIVYNSTTQNMTIAHESASEGTASRRIVTLTGANILTTGQASCALIYDAAQSRWVAWNVEA